ncbi:MAG: enhanced serine sensitivity protein SseB [Ruminococcus sp.]|nr:enhanced serine sensitivity protein SseB [Ruminococcus sp.]
MSNISRGKMEKSQIPAEEIKNPELLKAIEKMQADGSKENIDAMINEIIKAKLILPAKITPTTQAKTENGRTVMQQANQVQFRLLKNGNGEMFFGVFSDVEEMYKWEDTKTASKVVTDFDSLASMVMDEKSNVGGFVINAFGKSVTFPKPMVMSIKQQRDYLRMKNNTIESGTKIQLGEPDEYPIDLMAALINHFSTETTVNAAYLRMIKKEDGQKSYFIVVDFYGDMQETFDYINKIAKPYLDDEIELTMMPYSMEFARNAVNGIEPFYKKEANN